MPEPELDTRRPFTRAQARQAGIGPRRLRSGEFRRLFRDVYIDASVPDSPDLRVQGALLLFDGSAWASHASAARMRGVPLPPLPDEHVTVADPKLRRTRGGVVCHVARTGATERLRGIRVSSVTAMFRELSTQLTLVDLVVVGDHLVRKGLVSPALLVKACRGSSRAAAAAAYVREGVDSPMETRLRMLIVLAGLPEPRVNLTIRDVDGEPIRRYDLSWPQVKVIVEYDGRHHIEREDQWESDLERREAIDDDEWRLLVVVARGVYSEPDRTVARIFRVLRKRGLPGLPLQPSDAYRPHFPGHQRAS
jgi:hypothetical protein